jgi:hypothetical protein
MCHHKEKGLSHFRSEVASAPEAELPVARSFSLAPDPVLRLPALRLPCHRIELLDSRIKVFAFGHAVLGGGSLNDGVDGRRRSSGRWLPLLLCQIHLLVKGQALGHANDALDEGVVHAAVGLRPEGPAAVSLAQINGACLRYERQKEEDNYNRRCPQRITCLILRFTGNGRGLGAGCGRSGERQVRLTDRTRDQCSMGRRVSQAQATPWRRLTPI